MGTEMNIKTDKFHLIIKWAVLLFAYMIMTSIVLNVTFTNSYFHFHLPEGPTAFQKIVYAEANRPFVYRALAPFLIRSLTHITPDTLKSKISDVVESRDILEIFGFRKEYATEYVWSFVLLYCSLIGFALVLRKFIATFYRSPSYLADFAPLGALACIPLLGSYFIYDYPNLMLFTGCLLFMAQKNFKLFYPIYILTCFSKETAILIPFIFFLNYSLINDKKKYWIHLVTQVIIWILISAFLRYIFRDNPGQLLETHFLGHNLSVLTNPFSYFKFTANALPKDFNIFMLAIIALLTTVHWKEKAIYLRRASAILIPMIALALAFGWVEEIRMYYESVPIFYILCLHSVTKIFNIPIEQTTDFSI
ncbi:MAG: hypothetical protein JXA92_14090 [candidate division Zixibacteria bacterium]|nr:hypothetical protein [candidate division Zixibacteria bacterium]